MHLKVIPQQTHEAEDCLKEVLCLPGAGRLFLRHLLNDKCEIRVRPSKVAIPAEWLKEIDQEPSLVQGFGPGGIGYAFNGNGAAGLLLSNARMSVRCHPGKLHDLLDASVSEVVAIAISPKLAAPNDLVRRTTQNHIVGCRRILEDLVEPAAFLATDFPAFLYFPPRILRQLGRDAIIPAEYEAFYRWVGKQGIAVRTFRLGGDFACLDTPEGVLQVLGKMPARELAGISSAAVHPSARLLGPVWTGDNVCIEKNTVIVGPTILCEGVRVSAGALVDNAIIGPNLTVDPGDCLRNVLWVSEKSRYQAPLQLPAPIFENEPLHEAHRDWPLWSYPRLGKRIFDIIFSLAILLLISPVFLIVAMMLKLTSPGPLFYRARRQGQHGREFNCLKFRSMMVQADSLQERLRGINQVDGPQFKIENDPRITGVGKFLRDTCIDELPQFINVLLGQMSVVGPRPSPENENEACPPWRDARLSVRPGITGLWQVCRTRQAEMDFQEWIYYDTQYVRNLSFWQDISICVKTASKLINTFLDQFG